MPSPNLFVMLPERTPSVVEPLAPAPAFPDGNLRFVAPEAPATGAARADEDRYLRAAFRHHSRTFSLAARLLPPEPKKKRGASGTVPAGVSAPADLSDDERALFNLLSTDSPSHIDALAEASKLAVPDLSSALLGLEMFQRGMSA